MKENKQILLDRVKKAMRSLREMEIRESAAKDRRISASGKVYILRKGNGGGNER
jgi:hypothetical protein